MAAQYSGYGVARPILGALHGIQIAGRVAQAIGTELSPSQPHPAGITLYDALGITPGALVARLVMKLRLHGRWLIVRTAAYNGGIGCHSEVLRWSIMENNQP